MTTSAPTATAFTCERLAAHLPELQAVRIQLQDLVASRMAPAMDRRVHLTSNTGQDNSPTSNIGHGDGYERRFYFPHARARGRARHGRGKMCLRRQGWPLQSLELGWQVPRSSSFSLQCQGWPFHQPVSGSSLSLDVMLRPPAHTIGTRGPRRVSSGLRAMLLLPLQPTTAANRARSSLGYQVFGRWICVFPRAIRGRDLSSRVALGKKNSAH